MTLEQLFSRIESRKSSDPKESWTAALLDAGPQACARKFAEESIEAVIEAVEGNREALTQEAADVIYHLLVMLAARDVAFEDVLRVLEQRSATSGIEEKAARGQ